MEEKRETKNTPQSHTCATLTDRSTIPITTYFFRANNPGFFCNFAPFSFPSPT